VTAKQFYSQLPHKYYIITYTAAQTNSYNKICKLKVMYML